MLDTMRRHSESFLIYLIFGAIIIVFAVSFGPGSGSCTPTRTGYAAVVDGDMIPQQTYGVLYRRQVEDLRRRMMMANMPFSNDMVERMGIKTQVLDTLVSTKLLAHEAERHGLTVTTEELVAYLADNLGIRDITPEQYKSFVERNFETTVARFEESVREQILADKMQRVITAGISVADREVKDEWVREHDRAMITFVKLSPDNIDVPEPGPAEIDELLASDMAAVEARYNEEALRYRTPMRVEARQIVRKLPAGASDADAAKARGELLDMRTQIKEGADFAALAKQHSEDPATAAKGGDMGELQRGSLPRPLDQAVFSLQKGDMTAEPVRTPEGLHLVQVTEIHPPARRPLDEVKHQVAAEVLQQRAAVKLAEQQAGALLAQLKAGQPLEELTVEASSGDKSKPARRQSPWILATQDGVPAIGSSPELHDAIFALTKEKPLADEVFEVNGSYFVVRLDERETPDLAAFESEKESLRAQAIQVKGNRVLRDWIQHLRQKAHIEYNPALFPPEQEPA